MKNLFALSTLLLAFGGLSSTAAAADAHWSYAGLDGPEHWADLDPANVACRASKSQSPINIDTAQSQRTPLPPLTFNYNSGSAEVVNNGHTIQVNVPAGNLLNVGDVQAGLLQFHFHTPSEEHFDGKAYPMDAHLVHRSADGVLWVVAVQFTEGKENQALKPIFAYLPGTGKNHVVTAFAPSALLPNDPGYYRFTGSLTTPPCSDGVRWQVLKQPLELSREQIDAFRALFPMNARPVQPLNGRVIEVSE
ncbi:carbonic anhydrase [Pseudomonas sp. TE3786]